MSSADRVKSDQLLRNAVLAGDEQAWQRWYEETFDDLYRYVHWRCGGQGDRTDEVVQETWLTAVRRVRQFDPRQASFSSWLQGIAVNVLRNQLRRQQTAGKRRRPLGSEPVAKCHAESTVEDRQRRERIIAVLDALPEQYESVLRAKYLDGLSVAEIAARWDKTAKAVESLLTRARQKFRDRYRRFEQDGKSEQIGD